MNTSFFSRKFCDYIAHELANPLDGMLVSVEVIEEYFEANPRAMDEIGDLLEILKKEIKRLTLFSKSFVPPACWSTSICSQHPCQRKLESCWLWNRHTMSSGESELTSMFL